jgi:diacylglycerol kinase
MRLLGKKHKFLHNQGKEKFTKSVGHALDGIEYAINNERNIKIEILIGIITSVLGFILQISLIEWITIILVISMILTLELINTAIERCVDLVTKEYHDLAKAAKDVAAGAVFIMSMFSIIIGIIIFLPKMINMLGW